MQIKLFILFAALVALAAATPLAEQAGKLTKRDCIWVDSCDTGSSYPYDCGPNGPGTLRKCCQYASCG